MHRRKITTLLSGAAALLFGWTGLGLRWSPAGQPADTMVGMMGSMMGVNPSDRGMHAMMSPENMMGPMRLGMKLFEHHAEIQRKTTYLSNGLIDTTTSSDPAVAGYIQAHVVEMYGRLADNRPFPYPASHSVAAMFANSTRYRRSYKLLPDGIEVTETSNDPEMVKVIYAHAEELDAFARYGMPAMMREMMEGQP